MIVNNKGVYSLRAFGLMLCVFAAGASAEDLLFHYQHALESDPKYLSAAANRGASQKRVTQAQAGLLPTLDASAARNRHDEEITTDATISSRPTGEARYSSSEYRLKLSQPIYNAVLFASYRVADADLRRAEAEYGASRQELMLRVAQAYLDVLLAQESLALAGAEKETLSRQLESAEARLKAGAGSITDVHDARARFQVIVAQESEARNQTDDKRQALREISGQIPGELAAIGKEIPFVPPEPADVKSWMDTAARQNLSVQAAQAAEESARQTVAQHRAGHHPTLSFVGSRTRTDADASIPGPGVRSDETVIGLQLSVPLFQGGLVSARTDEATFRLEAARQDLEARRRAVERGARSAFLGVTGAKTKVEALKQTVEAATASVVAKTEGYSAGVYTAVNVLDATRDLYRAHRDHAEARHNYLLSLLQLKFAAGTLSDADLISVNSWLGDKTN